MPLDPTFPPRISTDSPQVKKWIFSGRVFYADSECMLDVTYRPILAEKSPKNLFFGKTLAKKDN
jgi:hypothetical protein